MNTKSRTLSNTKWMAVATVAALAVGGLTAGIATADSNNSNDNGRNGKSDDCASSGQSRGGSLDVIGLTANNRLICFSEKRPGRAENIGTVVGLMGDASLVGIDFRPANSELIGLGNAGGIYSIDPATGNATKKSMLNVALTGSFFGVDFNPTVDRLRITSDTGQSLRANVDTGATQRDDGPSVAAHRDVSVALRSPPFACSAGDEPGNLFRLTPAEGEVGNVAQAWRELKFFVAWFECVLGDPTVPFSEGNSQFAAG